MVKTRSCRKAAEAAQPNSRFHMGRTFEDRVMAVDPGWDHKMTSEASTIDCIVTLEGGGYSCRESDKSKSRWR